MSTWKYGMIKVAEEHGEDVCELVEVYSQSGLISGPYTSFCRPFLTSIKCLQMALKDVERDGINTWFWENGTFSWKQNEYFWDWKSNKGGNEE